jgi:hypothetical protein
MSLSRIERNAQRTTSSRRSERLFGRKVQYVYVRSVLTDRGTSYDLRRDDQKLVRVSRKRLLQLSEQHRVHYPSDHE